MSWRTVLITHKAKASYKDGYMIVNQGIEGAEDILSVVLEQKT